MNIEEAQERTADAGEYVLGTLTALERQALEARLPTDAELKAEVYAWQDQLLGLNPRIAPMAVRPELWQRIAGRLGSGGVKPLSPPAANDPVWRSVGFWRATSGLALAASVLMGTLLLSNRLASPDAAEPRYLAMLQSPDKATGWVVESLAGGMVRLVPVGDSPEVPEGKTMQFWTKPQGAKGPTSLGLVKVGEAVVVPASSLPGMGKQQLFELTLEPSGGSTIGKPTGPILFVGRAVQI